MLIKQISVFVENSKGRLAEITRILADNQLNISALSIADTTSFGILRIIVDEPERTESVLKNAGLTVSVTDVLSLEIDDRPGELSKALTLLSENDIEVDYAYAFISRTTSKASVIIRVENDEAAEALLKQAGFNA